MAEDHVFATEIFLQDSLTLSTEKAISDPKDFPIFLSSFLSDSDLAILQNTIVDDDTYAELNDVCFALLHTTASRYKNLEFIIENALDFSETATSLTSSKKISKISPAAIISISVLLLLSVDSLEIKTKDFQMKLTNHPIIGQSIGRIIERLTTADEVHAVCRLLQNTTPSTTPREGV